MRRGRLLFVGSLLLLLGAGCAHVLEFRTPAEFRGKKVKEDPPGVYAPMLYQGPRPC